MDYITKYVTAAKTTPRDSSRNSTTRRVAANKEDGSGIGRYGAGKGLRKRPHTLNWESIHSAISNCVLR